MVHDNACELQALDGFGAGFSCTSYSMLNKDSLKNATAMDRAAKQDPDVSWLIGKGVGDHQIQNLKSKRSESEAKVKYS